VFDCWGVGTGVGSGKGVAGLGVFGAVAKSDGFMLAADSGLDDMVDGGERGGNKQLSRRPMLPNSALPMGRAKLTGGVAAQVSLVDLN